MGEPGADASGTGVTSVIRDVLEQLRFPGALTLAEVVALHHDHPRWAVWVPAPGGEWAAVRPAGLRLPGPEVPMLWVRAGTAAELGRRMTRADAGLPPSGQR
jgi:hypothetical protein